MDKKLLELLEEFARLKNLGNAPVEDEYDEEEIEEEFDPEYTTTRPVEPRSAWVSISDDFDVRDKFHEIKEEIRRLFGIVVSTPELLTLMIEDYHDKFLKTGIRLKEIHALRRTRGLERAEQEKKKKKADDSSSQTVLK